MSAAVLGLAGVIAGGLLALLGVLRTTMPPAHLADIEGLHVLLDEIRAERDDLRRQLTDCLAENTGLRGGPPHA